MQEIHNLLSLALNLWSYHPYIFSFSLGALGAFLMAFLTESGKILAQHFWAWLWTPKGKKKHGGRTRRPAPTGGE